MALRATTCAIFLWLLRGEFLPGSALPLLLARRSCRLGCAALQAVEEGVVVVVAGGARAPFRRTAKAGGENRAALTVRVNIFFWFLFVWRLLRTGECVRSQNLRRCCALLARGVLARVLNFLGLSLWAGGRRDQRNV